MSSFFASCKVPGKKDCENCLRLAGNTLMKRSWKDVKNFVHNHLNRKLIWSIVLVCLILSSSEHLWETFLCVTEVGYNFIITSASSDFLNICLPRVRCLAKKTWVIRPARREKLISWSCTEQLWETFFFVLIRIQLYYPPPWLKTVGGY